MGRRRGGPGRTRRRGDRPAHVLVGDEHVVVDGNLDGELAAAVADTLAVLPGRADEPEHVVGLLVQLDDKLAGDAVRHAHDTRRLRVLLVRLLEPERHVGRLRVEKITVRVRQSVAENTVRAVEVDVDVWPAGVGVGVDPVDAVDLEFEVVAPHSILVVRVVGVST
jgi:hypothetical protein